MTHRPDKKTLLRLQFLARVIHKECRHLMTTDQRLFNHQFDVERAAQLDLNPWEPLIYSSMSRVASQIGKIATRTAQVVAGTTMPSRTRKRAPDLAATRMGRGLAGELPRCVSCQGE